MYLISKYFTKYKELATGKWKDHNLVIVSVNPVVDGKSYTNKLLKAER